MKMFIEFHLIQNFSPSNLNRDDTGSPKEAMFGGFRRARVSSQCFKRAIRKDDRYAALISAENRAIRTKKLQQEVINRLPERDAALVAKKLEEVLDKAKLKLKKKDKDEAVSKTKYLLFLGEKEIRQLVRLIDENWDATDLKWTEGVVKKLDGGHSVDVALFGRMLADLPVANRDAACQVAHAISTHRVDREFDYYTAVDDYEAPEDRAEEVETGAGMIGLVEFNAATFYRYAVLDLAKLYENLLKDPKLTLAAVEAFTEGFARAIPTGKQNSFAAHNLPHFIGVCVREGAPLNLANAFESPIWARNEASLTQQSVARLGEYEARLGSAYGSEKDAWFYMNLTEAKWPSEKGEAHASLKSLSARVRKEAATILGGGALE